MQEQQKNPVFQRGPKNVSKPAYLKKQFIEDGSTFL